MSDIENPVKGYGKEEFAWALGKVWGSLRFLQMYHPDNPLRNQLEEIIKSLEEDVSRLVYNIEPTPSERS